MKLYDIPIEANLIEAELSDNAGELTPELEQRIAGFLRDGKDKIEAAAIVVRSLEDDAEICRGEAARLLKRAEGLEASANRLKGLMLFAVDEGFSGKVKTAKFTVWGQNSAASVGFELKPGIDIYRLVQDAPWCVRTSDPVLDRKALHDAHKAGVEMPAALDVQEKPPTRYLRIK